MVANPGAEAGKQARELHRLAFPEQYEQEQKPEGNPEVNAEEGGTTAPEGGDPNGQQTGKPEGDEATKPESAGNPPAPQEGEKGADYWRQRFDVLQGKYNAEVPRLTQKVTQLGDRVNTLLSEIQQSAPKKDAEGEKTVEEQLDALEEEYGAAFAHALDGRIDKHLNKRLAPVEQRMGKVEKSTSQSAIDTALDRMFAQGSLPDWRQLNEDPAFYEWLQNPAPFTRGKTLYQVLNAAYEAGDIAGTAEVFITYQNLTSQAAPPAQPQKQPPKAPPISPPKRGGGPQSQIDASAGDVLRMGDFEALMQQKRLGQFKGTEADFLKKKAEFIKASQDGRLIG